MTVHWRWVGVLPFLLAVAAATREGVAEDAVLTPAAPEVRINDPALSPPASPDDVERAIQGLQQPIDQETVQKIFFDVMRLENSQEQERLRQLLAQRLQALQQVLIPPPAFEAAGLPVQPPQPLPPAMAEGELLMRFETLNLGPDATADDLRARDQLISEIAGIRDPVMQRELLTKLEEREREQKGVTEKP